MSVDSIQKKEKVIYGVMWLLITLFCVVHGVAENASQGHPLYTMHDALRTLNVVLPLCLLFVINNFILLPLLLHKHRLGPYLLSVIVLIAFTAWFQYKSFSPLSPPSFPGHPGPGVHPPHRSLIPIPLVHDLLCASLVVLVNVAISLSARQIISNMEKERLISVNIEGQLQHLKAQINPHFYMNMLNNIHGLVDSNPEKAKDMIFDMSRLMHYMLYDSTNERIPLAGEIAFLEDYVRIMSRRFARNKVTITAEFPPSSSVASLMVAPLLFLVFIENAFKHGIDYREESFVDVSMRVDDDNIVFRCCNSRPKAPGRTIFKGGIGLENVKRRLKLLYDGKASLHIDESPNIYAINLTVPYETENSDNRR